MSWVWPQMVVSHRPFIRTALLLPQIKDRDGIPLPQSHLSPLERDSLPLPSFQTPPAPPSPSSRISPAVLFIIVILAVIFFISGLLHLLVRFLIRKHPSSHRSGGHPTAEAAGSADTLQRQLQQLFHLHDAGLEQAFIDALPVFLYREIIGPKEPFDCAVCLCEFTPEEKLRLLPVCGHAFHLNCIDTWLLSNSTCPLCRGSLFVPGLTIENPIFDFEDPREEEELSGEQEDDFPKPTELEEIVAEKRVFPVRLGKFRNLSNPTNADVGDDGAGSAISNARRETGEASSSNLDARRCYSMGSYQYIVADASVQVELPRVPRRSGDDKGVRGRGLSRNAATANEDVEGKRLGVASRGESFSVSKIWQWSNKKGKFPISSDVSLDRGLPWMVGRRSVEDT